MEKPRAEEYPKNPYLRFDHFNVKQESKHFYGVYENGRNILITSGVTLQNASKKAQLLEIGYEIGREDARDIFFEEHNWL